MKRVVISMHNTYYAAIGHLVTAAAVQNQVQFSTLRELSPRERKSFARTPIHVKDLFPAAARLKTERGVRREDLFILVVDSNIMDEEDDEYFVLSGANLPDWKGGGLSVVSLYYLNPASAFMREGKGWWSAKSGHEKKLEAANSVLLNLLAAIVLEVTELECHKQSQGCIMDYCQTPVNMVVALKNGFRFCDQPCSQFLKKHPFGPAMLKIAEWLNNNPIQIVDLEEITETANVRAPRDQNPALEKRKLQVTSNTTDKTTETANIFISYRREDSADIAGRIYDRLAGRFGRDCVFKDVDSMPLGIDFRKSLERALSQCTVLLAIVGRNWLETDIDTGKRRIDDPGDYTRIEIEAALKRKIPLIPVLVQGGSIPKENELPSTLKGLPYLQKLDVRPDPDFQTDMERLIAGIESARKVARRRTARQKNN
jgi:hypothetical protein